MASKEAIGPIDPKPGAIWTNEGESFKTGSSLTEMRKEAYIEWLLTPTSERVPSTKKEFAAMYEVTTQTLRNYARDPKVQSELVRRGRAINKVERAQDVLDSLYNMATSKGDLEYRATPAAAVSAAKVWLDWTDQQVSEGNDIPLEELSKEELLALVSRVYDVVDDSA
ncbi:hypothetical protein LCGC14_1947560 [marine sediment metagenome]|uniref:Uncharacterized protein n=1 Tax=marine sediment metagenome TaxID=412755 RepID=A0A0F9FIC0_9ZZZZ